MFEDLGRRLADAKEHEQDRQNNTEPSADEYKAPGGLWTPVLALDSIREPEEAL